MRTPVLQKRNDDFSYQVYTEADRRFWFRLVREGDRDLITDFFLGSFPPDESGALLAACYRTLELTPGPIVVFRDILSSREPRPDLVDRARDFYTQAGSGLLNEFGCPAVQIQLEELRNKINLVLTAERKS
jgi:hypothetical protein